MRRQGERPELRRWFRDRLAADSRRLQDQRDSGGPTTQPDLQELRSLYSSYRLDQVAHMIALVRAEDFERACSTPTTPPANGGCEEDDEEEEGGAGSGLFPHQLRTVRWMRQREAAEPAPEPLPSYGPADDSARCRY